MELEGRILKGVSGQYTVLCRNGETLLCPAKGLFRKSGETPYAGDLVRVLTEESAGERTGVIQEILPRTSLSKRPPVANLDRLLLVVSSTQPVPNALVLDRLIALAECKGIEPLLVFTKADLHSVEPWLSVYRNAGFTCAACDLHSGLTLDGIPVENVVLPWLEGHVTGLCGNSGVGKTTLLSMLFRDLDLQTGEVSEKLGRGRHTTRQVELYPVAGGFVADTPGFSSWDTETGELIVKEALARGFREFDAYRDGCRFDDCSHTVEKGCAVRQAVKRGEIAKSRHESYCALYDEVKSLQAWQLEKRGGVVR